MTICLPPQGALNLAARLLDRVEGTKLRPYQDSAGVWTIGTGCTRINGQPVTAHTAPITAAQARDALVYELDRTVDFLGRVVQVPLALGPWAAAASMAYNLGPGARGGKDGFATLKSGRPTTILTLINAGHLDQAADEILAWDKVSGRTSAGILNRRLIERAVWLTAQVPVGVPPDPRKAAPPAKAAPTKPAPSRAASSARRRTDDPATPHVTADDLNAAQLTTLRGTTEA